MLQVIPVASEEQLLLVELVRSVSAMRTETVMQTVKEVLKQPPAIAKDKVSVKVVLNSVSSNGFTPMCFSVSLCKNFYLCIMMSEIIQFVQLFIFSNNEYISHNRGCFFSHVFQFYLVHGHSLY